MLMFKPVLGTRTHSSIDRAHGLIRNLTATHAAARLEEVLDRTNTTSEAFADRPNARRRTKRCFWTAASSRAFNARSPKTSRCRSACASPMRERRRAFLCALEGTDGPVRHNDLSGSGAAQDRPRDSCLRHAPICLAPRSTCSGVGAERCKNDRWVPRAGNRGAMRSHRRPSGESVDRRHPTRASAKKSVLEFRLPKSFRADAA